MSMHYSEDELRGLGVASVGRGVLVHRGVLLLNAAGIRIGDHSRIDAQAILSAGSGGIHIGRHVHLSAGVYIFGGGGRVLLDDYSGLSSRCAVYTASDDYTDGWLTNPTVPDRYRKVQAGPVSLHRHALVGAGSVILPGVTLARGCSVGALSLVTRDIGELEVAAGHPARRIARRSERLWELERQLEAEEAAGVAR